MPAAGVKRIQNLVELLQSRQSSSPNADYRLMCSSRLTGDAWQREYQAQQHDIRLRSCTILELAADLAGNILTAQQLQLISPLEQEALVCSIWHEMEPSLSTKARAALGAGPGFARTLLATLQELRLSGIESSTLDFEVFPIKERGKVLYAFLERYESVLRSRLLGDPATVLLIARDRLIDEGLPDGIQLILPEEDSYSGLSQSLLDQIPEDRLIQWTIADPDFESASDVERLAWLFRPQEAPPARKDCSVTLQRALSPEFEVRAVLKNIVEEQIAFDEVEVFYSDESVYPGLFHSVMATVQPASDSPLPLSLGGGVPINWTRPGKAVRFWLDWVESQLHQHGLRELLSQHLLELPGSVDADDLLRTLQNVPDCSGPAAWLNYFNKQLKRDNLKQQERQEFSKLTDLLTEHIGLLPASHDDVAGAWNSLKTLLERHTRVINVWDREAQAAGLALIHHLESAGYRSVSTVWERMRYWATAAALPKQAPQPGCLHLSPIAGMETAWRKFTYCVGLSDESFPSIPQRSSLLTDRERKSVSPELSHYSMREQLHRQSLQFINSLKLLPGKVQFSYTCADQADDREQFPSQLFVQVFRLTSQLLEGDLHDLESWLGAPLGPGSPSCRLTDAENWLNQLPDRPYHDALFRKAYPLLSRGAYAVKQRSSFQFSEHDGSVPAAGRLYDLQRVQTVFSAQSLQQYARCPLQFFYRHVLNIPVHEALESEPGRWLHPLIRGTILHTVFFQFHQQLQNEKRRPDKLHDAPLLRNLLQETISAYEDALPTVSPHMQQSELHELHETLNIFLGEETDWASLYSPKYFETSIGLPPISPGNVLDKEQPMTILLPSGRRLPVQGRIDRIDEVQPDSSSSDGPPTYYIWDYKTGRMKDYQGDFVRRTGQLLQPLLYLEIVEKRLREAVDQRAMVKGAGYFFPGNRGGQGDRLQWQADTLRQDIKVLDILLDLLQSGVFLATDNADSCRNCEYQLACDLNSVTKQAVNKQKNPDNGTLRPLYQLRRSP